MTSNRCSLSPLCQCNKCTLTPRRSGKALPPQATALTSLPPRPQPGKPVWVELSSRRGPELWIHVRARGATITVPGHTAIWEVLRMVNAGYLYHRAGATEPTAGTR